MSWYASCDPADSIRTRPRSIGSSSSSAPQSSDTPISTCPVTGSYHQPLSRLPSSSASATPPTSTVSTGRGVGVGSTTPCCPNLVSESDAVTEGNVPVVAARWLLHDHLAASMSEIGRQPATRRCSDGNYGL